MTYEFDVTAGSTPLGTVLTTIGDADLLAGSGFRVAKLTAGAVDIVIGADNPKAAFLTDDCYVRIRDTVLGTYIAGGFPTEATVKLVSERRDRRVLTRSGEGSLAYMRRGSLRETNFSTDPVASPDVFTREPGMAVWLQQPWGAILVRGIQEGQDMPGNPLAALTYTFTRTVDSAAVPWTLIDESGFSTAWGTNLYDLLQSFVRQGLIPVMSHGLQLSAYETYGSDHSGAAYGASVVRFQVGASATDLLANIMTDAERVWVSSRISHLLVIGGDGVTTVLVTDATAPVKKTESWTYPESSDPAILAGAGQAELARRALRTIGSLKLPVKLGDNPLVGEYRPGPGRPLWPANTITVFTGSAQYDINADMPVAALECRLSDTRGWEWTAELGSSFIDRSSLAQQRAVTQIVKSSTPRPHSHPEMLCRPGSGAGESSLVFWDWAGITQEPVVAYSAISQPATSSPFAGTARITTTGGPTGQGYCTAEALYNFTLPAGKAQGGSYGIGFTSLPVTAGKTYRFSRYQHHSGGLVELRGLVLIWVSGAYDGTDSGFTQISQTNLDFSAPAWTLATNDVVAPTGATGVQIGLGGKTELTDISLNVVTSGAVNDGHPDLVGTGSRNSRCGHKHHVLRTTNPTVNDDWATAGYPVTTLWTNTVSGDSFLLTNAATGAAVWSPFGDGLSQAEVDALIATHAAAADPHTGYQREAEKGAANGYASLGATSLVPMTQLATGTPDGTKFVRDDGTLVVPGGGGGGMSNPMTAVGDIIKGGTAGAAERLAIGTAGHVLKVVSGAPAWAAEAGGGGSTPGLLVPPFDVPPGTAHADDDEFGGSTLNAAWTAPLTSNAGNAITTTVANEILLIEPTAGSRRAYGIRKPSPTGSFSVMAKLLISRAAGAAVAPDTRAGIFVATTAGRAHVLGAYHHSTGNNEAAYIGATTYSETADWSAWDGVQTTFGINYPTWRWFRFVWDAGTSTLSFEWSGDGFVWRTLGSRAAMTQPDRMGLVVYSQTAAATANTVKLLVDWFRVTEP